MANELSSKDFKLIEEFLGYVLDRFKEGDINKSEAIGELAHPFAAIDRTDGDDWRKYMKSVIAGALDF